VARRNSAPFSNLTLLQSCIASASAGERNGRKDVQEVGEGRKEGRCQPSHCKGGQTAQDGAEIAVPQGREADPPLGRQPSDREGLRRRPVQAYIAAMPGWKSDVGRRLDALIMRAVPGVHNAVKWNSSFYGIEGKGWFLNFHCFTMYVKVAFFRGTSLRPVPPGASKHKEVRYLDIHEDDQLDEAQFSAWVKQASQLPGERM
jgi:hypothetical protein